MSYRRTWVAYAIAPALCALTTLVAFPLRGQLDKANIVMIYLLAVFVVAVRLGRGPAVLTALLSVALFDFFFVPPYISFTVADAQYLVTFGVMLAVGLITSHLAAQLGERSEAAEASAQETRVLYDLARDLGATLSYAQVAEVLDRFLANLGMHGGLLVSESLAAPDALRHHGGYLPDEYETAQARAAYRENAAVESVALGASEPSALFLPFAGTTRVRGVLVATAPASPARLRAKRPLLGAVASLVGIAIERIHFADIAQQSELDAQTEKLRSSILSSISHDLRTPLTTLVGLADSVADTRTGLPAEVRETAEIIRGQAYSMHRMVSNLLEMARLQSGRVVLNRQWQPLDEVIGSSTRLLGELLARRRLLIDLPADLPLVSFDAVLIERVFCNLLENAAKYSDDGAVIEIAAAVDDGRLEVGVCNEGSGFPAGRMEQLFELFVRGEQEAAVPGTGIGLALCRAIVGAHGGSIVAENRQGKACVRFTLPQETPPAVDGEWS
ncbi:DUF4118 domain-containing protein [Azospira restricta]|uniref:histidine kinase n=1 Tax=Azospira restricta TaxID=404405 RepID=A0A974SMJ1_9RHOO|nr:DUF4118 domain-containing protein [Azospira restricta]QRJ63116.1 DUF4118 domain-containing protein [Azospira restricta]